MTNPELYAQLQRLGRLDLPRMFFPVPVAGVREEELDEVEQAVLERYRAVARAREHQGPAACEALHALVQAIDAGTWPITWGGIEHWLHRLRWCQEPDIDPEELTRRWREGARYSLP